MLSSSLIGPPLSISQSAELVAGAEKQATHPFEIGSPVSPPTIGHLSRQIFITKVSAGK